LLKVHPFFGAPPNYNNYFGYLYGCWTASKTGRESYFHGIAHFQFSLGSFAERNNKAELANLGSGFIFYFCHC